MRRGLLVVEVVAGDRLADQGGDEDREEEQRQRVVADPALHRCERPTIEKKTMPAISTTTQIPNISRIA
jgi:hypothetical protein